MSYTLNALYVEIDNNYQFYRYFWEGMDAFYFGESSRELVDKKVTSYRIEEHRISEPFKINQEYQYYKLAENYEILNPSDALL